MSGDVLLTGTDRDLHPRDVFVDSRNSTELAAQQVLAALGLWRGEWVFDNRLGVDWLSVLTSRRVDLDKLTAQIRDAVHQVSVVTLNEISAAKAGQSVSISIRVTHNNNQVTLPLIFDPAKAVSGDNRAITVLAAHVRPL
jgi:hypothetical protein